MTDNSREMAAGPTSWDKYWELTPEAAAHRAGGPQDKALTGFWGSEFACASSGRAGHRLLDFACGNGVVTRFATQSAYAEDRVIGLDLAPSAIKAYRTRFPGAGAVVSEARRTPFADASFDMVASQFGLEYAGMDSIGEAARLVAPGGALVLVIHMKDGAIFRECMTNLDAMRRVQDSRILAIVKEVFRRGSTAARGQGSRAEFLGSQERFAVAVNEVDAVLRDEGDQVAGGTIHRLYADLAQLYGRMAAFDPAEVSRWADRMALEVGAYCDRMTVMLEASIDEAELQRAADGAASSGLVIRAREAMPMGPGGGEPGAWVLACERP